MTSKSRHGQGRACVITRRANFSASHRYWLPELSSDENNALFGRCTNYPGHGHNYELIISMAGALNNDGMVLNLSEVKKAIHNEIINPLDFSFLNETWAEFDLSKENGCLPTTEALTRVIWNRIQYYLPLVSLRLYEEPRLWADYLGNSMEAYLTIRSHFSAAHRLAREELNQNENEKVYGKCARTNGHGHNYFLDVTVRGEINARTGMVCDLSALKRLVNDIIIERFDHTFLNKDIPHFNDCVPTAENIALYISDQLNSPIKAIGVNLHKIHLQESPNNSAEVYTESPKSNEVFLTAHSMATK